MKKLINKIKKWRLVGYVILIVEFFKIHDEQQAIIESFLLVVLGEISARTKTKTPTSVIESKDSQPSLHSDEMQ